MYCCRALLSLHFFPNPVLFFPVVKRFAVDLVNGSLRDGHVAWLSGHEEINVIDRSVGGFYIHTGEIFAAAETGKPIIVHPHQIDGQIFASVVDVKLSVDRIFAFRGNVSFDSGEDIGVGDFICRRLLRRSGW